MPYKDKELFKRYKQTERYKAYSREYAKRRNALPHVRESERRRRKADSPAAIRMMCKKHSARRGIRFELDLEFFKSIFGHPCFYCNQPQARMGLDRIDSDGGYTRNNVVPCCKRCNWAKNTASVKDFLSHCALIANNSGTVISKLYPAGEHAGP